MVNFCTFLLQILSKWSFDKLQERSGDLNKTKVRDVGCYYKNQQGVKLNLLYCRKSEKLESNCIPNFRSMRFYQK